MKRTSLLALSVIMSIPPSTFAQSTGATVVPVMTGAQGSTGRTYFGGAGMYRQVEENITQYAIQSMNAAQVTQKEDRDFVIAAVNQIHQAYVEYSESLISKDLLEMETRGTNGSPTEVDRFLKATSELKAKKAAFESLLVRNSSINKDVLPSNYTAVVTADGQRQAIPSVGTIKMDSVLAEYKKLMEQMDAQLASYKNIKVIINGQILTIADYKNILSPDFSKAPLISTTEVAEATEKMKDLRRQAFKAPELERTDFADLLRNEYNGFSKRYGADYKYIARSGTENESVTGKIMNFTKKWLWGSDESQTQTGKGDTVKVEGVQVDTDVAARNQSFKRLVDVFWMRSYLRLSQGIQLCAVQPKMVEASNFGAFQAIEALKELRTDVACGKKELEDALEYARRVLKYSGAQADSVFGQGFMKAGLLNKLGSATTFVLGNRPSAEALHMLIQLVYADIQEELIMATPGEGLQSLYAMYRARYQSSETQKTYYTNLRCSTDYNAKSCSGGNAFSENPNMGDIQTAFVNLKQKVQLAKDILTQADRINQAIEVSRASDPSSQKANERSGQL